MYDMNRSWWWNNRRVGYFYCCSLSRPLCLSKKQADQQTHQTTTDTSRSVGHIVWCWFSSTRLRKVSARLGLSPDVALITELRKSAAPNTFASRPPQRVRGWLCLDLNTRRVQIAGKKRPSHNCATEEPPTIRLTRPLEFP